MGTPARGRTAIEGEPTRASLDAAGGFGRAKSSTTGRRTPRRVVTSRASGSASTTQPRADTTLCRARLAAMFVATPRLHAGFFAVVTPTVRAVTEGVTALLRDVPSVSAELCWMSPLRRTVL